jgi:hypothetical protein
MTAAALTFAASASGQSTIGYGAEVVIPVVAQTPSYASEVFVSNPYANASTVSVNVTFVEGTTSSTPGLKSCTPISVPAKASVSFTLATQCSLSATSHFGMLILKDAAAEAVHPFFAYSRTQNPQGIGFSVEGFPTGNLSGQSQRVFGLKRVLAATPIPFQTNCFVGSFEQPIDYEIDLSTGAGQFLGSASGHLGAHQMVRHLDIFAAAGLAGDFDNVNAAIVLTSPTSPGNRTHPLYVGFCTVQDSLSFGADFRIGKSYDAWDATHSHDQFGCTPDCPTGYDYAVPDATHKQVFDLFVRTPDSLKCELLSDRLSELEMRLREPESYGDCDLCGMQPGSAGAPSTPGAVVAGGDNQTSFYYTTPFAVIRASDGSLLRRTWKLEVGARETNPAATGPIPFSLQCHAGNGTAWATPTTAVDDF